MTDYFDRLRSCIYTSPSGKAFVLLVDDVSRSAAKKAAVHELAGRDGSVVQDLGHGAKKYPISCVIAGANYDQTADALALALDETYTAAKPGKLQHPRWGDLDVCPLSYSQTEDLVNETRCARFQIDFIHAPAATISSTIASAPAIQAAADAAAALNVVDLATKTAADLAKVRKTITTTAKKWTSGLRAIKGATDTIKSEINATGLALQRGVDTLIQTPVDLCNSITSLVRIPARAEGAIASKVSTYATLITDAINGLDAATSAQAALGSTILAALGIASIETVTAGKLASRDDAALSAATLSSSLSGIIETIEAAEAATGFVFSPDLLEALVSMGASAQSYLLDQTFSLRLERRMVLTADSSPLVLIRALYGEVDDLDATLDEFIERNHLGGDSLLVIPRGTEVRYYV